MLSKIHSILVGMMNKQLLLLVCALVASAVTKDAKPKVGDIIDEAWKQLNELKSIIEGDILASHDELQNLASEFFTYGDNVMKTGEISLQQEHETVLGELTTIKELGHQANKDISSCTDIREQVLNRLPQRYGEQILHCIGQLDREVERILESSRFIIDTSINKVHELEFQLRRCEDSILCIEPIVTEIQMQMVRLPAAIKTEVAAASGYLNNLKVDAQDCANVKVAEYSSEANSILGDISACVDRILN